MLKGMKKLFTGDLLKVLCDMGHGDKIVIADANFPSHTMNASVIELPGIDAVTVFRAVSDVLPWDNYSDAPAVCMDMTDGDKQKGMPTPTIYAEYNSALSDAYGSDKEITLIDRFEFYERAKKAYAVIQTGEERQYGNLLFSKGVVL